MKGGIYDDLFYFKFFHLLIIWGSPNRYSKLKMIKYHKIFRRSFHFLLHSSSVIILLFIISLDIVFKAVQHRYRGKDGSEEEREEKRKKKIESSFV
jgi:hypothetical protein